MRLSPKASKAIDRQGLRRVVRTLAYGTVGGAVFFMLNMPFAWMMGAMVATTVTSLGGKQLYVPQSLRATMVMVLGMPLGSAFTQ